MCDTQTNYLFDRRADKLRKENCDCSLLSWFRTDLYKLKQSCFPQRSDLRSNQLLVHPVTLMFWNDSIFSSFIVDSSPLKYKLSNNKIPNCYRKVTRKHPSNIQNKEKKGTLPIMGVPILWQFSAFCVRSFSQCEVFFSMWRNTEERFFSM